jgi:hypothetical protein
MPEEKKSSITWSANDAYLRNFAAYFMEAQMYFKICRMNMIRIRELFDSVHEVYRMELPYFTKTEKDELSKKHDDMRKDVDNYLNQRDGYRKNNFGRLYYKIDGFFTTLTEKACEKGFFPKKMVERTVEEKAREGMLNR